MSTPQIESHPEIMEEKMPRSSEQKGQDGSLQMVVEGDRAPNFEIDAWEAQRLEKADDYVEFRTLGWVQAGWVSLAENIAMGLLSFPSIFNRLGMVGGVVATLGLGFLAYITAWIMVDFKLRYPGVMNYADAGTVMFGKRGGQILGVGMFLKSIGLGASHILGGQIALTSISSDAVCKIVFAVIITVVSILMSLQRHFGQLTIMSMISVTCILTASFITVVATGVQDNSFLIKNGVPVHWEVVKAEPTLADVIGAITNICFTYGGNMAVFSFITEMRRPQDFKKSFVIVQAGGATVYVLVGALIYSFGGQYVTSPALTMTHKPVRITAYAFGLVTILISGVVAVNVGAKYAYMTLFRHSPILTSDSWRARLYWVAIVAFMWGVGFIVAELIPFFNQLLTIISSLFSTWFSFGLGGFLWMHLAIKQSEYRWFNLKTYTQAPGAWVFLPVSFLSIILSIAVTPLGIYSAVTGIRDGYTNGSFSHPFSC